VIARAPGVAQRVAPAPSVIEIQPIGPALAATNVASTLSHSGRLLSSRSGKDAVATAIEAATRMSPASSMSAALWAATARETASRASSLSFCRTMPTVNTTSGASATNSRRSSRAPML
jgi:hypothetical protein